MKEITQDNYKDLEFNFYGIVIGYPKVDLYFNSEFYFIKQKIDYDTDKRYYIICGYNEEDQTCEGLAPDRLETNIENAFNCWSQINYYQFENMEEFCEWYLHKDDKLHESIDKFIKDTDKFYTKTKSTRREKYKDIIELFKYQHELSNLENQLCEAEITKDISKIEDCKMLLEIGKENFSRWLDSEVE